jgi:hypothetical protein
MCTSYSEIYLFFPLVVFADDPSGDEAQVRLMAIRKGLNVLKVCPNILTKYIYSDMLSSESFFSSQVLNTRPNLASSLACP